MSKSTRQRRPSPTSARRARAVRQVSRRILARARPRARLSDGIRRRADRGRLSRRADPGRVRRQRAAGSAPPPRSWRRCTPSGCNGAACHAQMYTMGTILRHGSAAQKQTLSAQDRQPANCACRPSASPSRPPAPTRWRCAPPRAREGNDTTSSTARRSGPRAPSIPT